MNGVKKLGYSKKQAAAATSLSVRSIDLLIANGKLKAMRSGRRVIISAESLVNYISNGCQGMAEQFANLKTKPYRPLVSFSTGKE